MNTITQDEQQKIDGFDELKQLARYTDIQYLESDSPIIVKMIILNQKETAVFFIDGQKLDHYEKKRNYQKHFQYLFIKNYTPSDFYIIFFSGVKIFSKAYLQLRDFLNTLPTSLLSKLNTIAIYNHKIYQRFLLMLDSKGVDGTVKYVSKYYIVFVSLSLRDLIQEPYFDSAWLNEIPEHLRYGADYEILSEQIEQGIKKRKRYAFGQAIDKYELSSMHIPLLLEQCIQYFYDNPQNLEQQFIFRKSVSESQLLLFIEQLEEGRWELLKDQEPHMVANVIKRFFTQQPLPFLDYEIYDMILSMQIQLDDRSVELVFQKIKTAQLIILKYLLEFIRALLRVSSVNLMNAESLSIIFTPCLLRPPTITMDYARNIKTLAKFIQCMIVQQ